MAEVSSRQPEAIGIGKYVGPNLASLLRDRSRIQWIDFDMNIWHALAAAPCDQRAADHVFCMLVC